MAARVMLTQDIDSDEFIMRCFQSGDQQAFELLFDRYSRLVLSVGLRILRDRGEAQELTQDVFLYLLNKGQSFDASRGTVRSWLVQIAYSRALDRRDYLLVRKHYDHREIDEELMETVPSSFSLDDTDKRRLSRAFADLNDRQRETLRLFFFEGYTLKEISVLLQETLGNTRNHYYRGLERLKDAMGQP